MLSLVDIDDLDIRIDEADVVLPCQLAPQPAVGGRREVPPADPVDQQRALVG